DHEAQGIPGRPADAALACEECVTEPGTPEQGAGQGRGGGLRRSPGFGGEAPIVRGLFGARPGGLWRHALAHRRTPPSACYFQPHMAAPDPNIGRDLLDGQFQILQKIGSGGMGSVYKAAQPAMNRMVAVKILHPKLQNRKDLVSRFRREARAMSHLQHPNTVKVFFYGELEYGSLYIVMEYLEGKNLNQVVRKEGPLPVERAIPVLVQVCGALEEAHLQGIVHRDLKPENIFLSTNSGLKDFPKVLDFGLPKVTEPNLRPGSL